jgi:hypothetical protein
MKNRQSRKKDEKEKLTYFCFSKKSMGWGRILTGKCKKSFIAKAKQQKVEAKLAQLKKTNKPF